MKKLIRSTYKFLVGVVLFVFDYLLDMVSGKHSDTVAFLGPGLTFSKKSEFEFITKDFLDGFGRIKDDVSVGRFCPICSAENSSHFCYSQDGLEYVICGNCSMIYTSKILTPEAYQTYQLKLLESEKGWVSDREEEEKNLDKDRFVSYIKSLKKHVRGGSLLDVGCFTGTFLECAREGGFNPSGVEIHEDKAAIAASKGFYIKSGNFEEVDIGDSYQVVTLWESLEHMNNPRFVVQKVRDILCDGGIIAFTVPNGDALSVKVLNGHLMWLTGIGHKNMFTPPAAAYLLKDCGFELVEFKTIEGPEMAAIINYFQDRIGKMDSFQNWSRLESGIYQSSKAKLLGFLTRPIAEHYNMGSLLFIVARKV